MDGTVQSNNVRDKDWVAVGENLGLEPLDLLAVRERNAGLELFSVPLDGMILEPGVQRDVDGRDGLETRALVWRFQCLLTTCTRRLKLGHRPSRLVVQPVRMSDNTGDDVVFEQLPQSVRTEW